MPSQHRNLGGVYRIVQRFRGGLVFKAHRLLYHSTLGLRVIKKKKKTLEVDAVMPVDAYTISLSLTLSLSLSVSLTHTLSLSVSLSVSHSLSLSPSLTLSHTHTHSQSQSHTLYETLEVEAVMPVDAYTISTCFRVSGLEFRV